MNIEQAVKTSIVELMGISESKLVDSASLVDDLSLDSLDLTEVCIDVEERLGIQIDMDYDDVSWPSTLGDFLKRIRDLVEEQRR